MSTNSSILAKPTKRGPGIPWVALALLGVIGYVLYRAAAGSQGFDWVRFRTALQSMDPWYCALAILFIILSYFGRAVRWEVMIRPLGPTPSLWRLFVGTAIGFTAVVLLGRPGEFVRPWWIARESRTSFASQLAVWLFERIYDLLIVILFFGFGLIHLASTGVVAKAGPELQMVVSSGGTLALMGAGVCLVFIFALRFLSPAQRQGLLGLIDKLPAVAGEKLRPLAGSFLEGAAACCEGKLQWLVIFYTLVEWAIIACCYWALFQAFPVTRGLNWGDIATVVGLVSFGAVVQLPGIGGGMQVVAIAVLTQLFGLGLEDSTLIAIVMWVTSFMLIVPVGVYFALREGLSIGKLSNLSGEAV